MFGWEKSMYKAMRKTGAEKHICGKIVYEAEP